MGLYGNPEIEGLEQVGQIDFSSGYYEFDYTTVWRREVEGDLSDPDRDVQWEYFYASDAGCSCPEPFQAFTDIGQLTKLEKLNDFHAFLVERSKQRSYDGDRTMQIVALIEKLHGLGVR